MASRWWVSGKFQAAELHSTEFPNTKGGKSHTPSTSDSPNSYADQLKVQKLNCEPSFENGEKGKNANS